MTRPPIGWRVLLALLTLLPQGALSRGWGSFARTRFPGPFQRALNRGFARVVGVDVEESEAPPERYPTLSDFFSRKLRPGARPWPAGTGMGSPVDGVLGMHGPLEKGIALQAKGISYGVRELLAGAVEPFDSGLYFTIYLSPRHYHRIHAPIGGRISEARAVPGRLLPVNRAAVDSVEGLFPRNERLLAFIEGGELAAAVVAVGAYNVGSISAAFDPAWNEPRSGGVTNRRGRRGVERRRYDPPPAVTAGEELMAFRLGSTVVILVAGKGGIQPAPHPALRAGMEIRVGTPLLASNASSSSRDSGSD